MANLLGRAKAVEAKLTALVQMGALTSLKRRPDMTRRWIAEPCQPPGSPGRQIILDTVHDAEIFTAGLESAAYGMSKDPAALRKTLEEELSLDEMNTEVIERYGEALNRLPEDD